MKAVYKSAVGYMSVVDNMIRTYIQPSDVMDVCKLTKKRILFVYDDVIII